MKKLRAKLFWTIFLILTLFLVTVSIIFNFESYVRKVSSINDNLNMMIRVDDRGKAKKEEFNPEEQKELPEEFKDREFEDRDNRMFMDVVLYTIELNENNEIVNIMSHNENNTTTTAVEKYAKKILSQDENKLKIGNLYLDKYSYKYEKNKYIVIIDNTNTRKELRSSLLTTLIICLVLEILIIIVSNVLTRWIIKPVEESFTKQKQFIQDASHELKTPLAVIMASSEALEKDNDKKWIKSIQNESERMNKLIKSLLDLAKVEDFNNKQNYKEENISKNIEKQLLSFESLLFENNIKLDYKIDENIFLLCDINQIKELVSILLDNAIKHSSNPGKIIINLTKEKNNVILEVINKGNPIPKGMEEKIFERFYRADESRNRNENRYGLGLSIARNIVTNHNGTITALSKDGYTTFKTIIKK